LHVNLAPPLLAKRDDDGHLAKSEYGPWMLKAFGLIKHLRFLRGTALDPFGRSEERRTERALIEEYVQTIEQLLSDLNPERIDLATQIAAVPEHIRGYGHVKEAHLAKAKAEREALLAQWQGKQLG
jgi:indolepyruvate ferredoxin oxidoreductase